MCQEETYMHVTGRLSLKRYILLISSWKFVKWPSDILRLSDKNATLISQNYPLINDEKVQWPLSHWLCTNLSRIENASCKLLWASQISSYTKYTWRFWSKQVQNYFGQYCFQVFSSSMSTEKGIRKAALDMACILSPLQSQALHKRAQQLHIMFLMKSDAVLLNSMWLIIQAIQNFSNGAEPIKKGKRINNW